jgi:hypothetical protein
MNFRSEELMLYFRTCNTTYVRIDKEKKVCIVCCLCEQELYRIIIVILIQLWRNVFILLACNNTASVAFVSKKYEYFIYSVRYFCIQFSCMKIPFSTYPRLWIEEANDLVAIDTEISLNLKGLVAIGIATAVRKKSLAAVAIAIWFFDTPPRRERELDR